jgi:uncharacterized protein
MKSKRLFPQELAYLLGIVILALSSSLMVLANYGVSMVIAPAYLVYVKLSAQYSFFTFGMAEYGLQGLLLIGMVLLLRQFKIGYLFSFITAIFYGLVLDLWMMCVESFNLVLDLPPLLYFITGLLLGAFGVALLFQTYISPEVYELFVLEVSARFGIKVSLFKTGYDILSCLLAIALSFLFYGFLHFEGVKWGTFVCALLNGPLIGLFGKAMKRHWDFVRVLERKKTAGAV